VDNIEIASSRSTRDLGIMISDDLECSGHIGEVISKAFKISNLILRIFKSKRLEIFKKAFYTLVLPILEYASVVWNPVYTTDVVKIESVLRRFTKRAQRKCGVAGESYGSRLKRWKIPTLEYRRVIADLVWVYKVLYGYVDVNRDLFFRIYQTDTEIKIYPLPLSSGLKNNTQTNTLAYRTYQIWNTLPLSVRNSCSVQAFKNNLKKRDLGKSFLSKLTM
jgi:hypothetical protein